MTDAQRKAMNDAGFIFAFGHWHRGGYPFKTEENAHRAAIKQVRALLKALASPPTGESKEGE